MEKKRISTPRKKPIPMLTEIRNPAKSISNPPFQMGLDTPSKRTPQVSSTSKLIMNLQREAFLIKLTIVRVICQRDPRVPLKPLQWKTPATEKPRHISTILKRLWGRILIHRGHSGSHWAPPWVRGCSMMLQSLKAYSWNKIWRMKKPC